MLSFFPLDVLDEIWDLIESVSEGFLAYSFYYRSLLAYCLGKPLRHLLKKSLRSGISPVFLCVLSLLFSLSIRYLGQDVKADCVSS